MRASKNDIKIRMIYEDNHLLVVEKPVNIASQQDESNDVDMLTLLKEDIKIRYQKPGNVYLGLVHRLDRPVGGVMVFAKTSKAASRLSDQIRNREIKKEYLAVVHGEFGEKGGRLEHYLLKDQKTNTVKTVNKSVEGAKEALLEYHVIQRIMTQGTVLDEKLCRGKTQNPEPSSVPYSLVKVDLHTGRSHQIRVQFAAIGHPLYGDQKYGSKVNKPGQQIALWSTKITLLHPTSHEKILFSCDPPGITPWNWFESTGRGDRSVVPDHGKGQ